jgi:hypothetical protein
MEKFGGAIYERVEITTNSKAGVGLVATIEVIRLLRPVIRRCLFLLSLAWPN